MQLDLYTALGMLKNGDLCLMLVKKKKIIVLISLFLSVLIEAPNE